MDLKRPLNWLKSKITKIEENLNETVKNCLKKNVYKFLGRNALYWTSPPAIERSVLGSNVSWDLKMMSTTVCYKVSST